MSEPDPTDVIPTMIPPTIPMAIVATGRTGDRGPRPGGCGPVGDRARSAGVMAAAPTSSAAPRAICTLFSADFACR